MNAMIIALTAASATASIPVEITEAWVGVSGNDGTADWFELTNNSNADFSTAGMFYDDESMDFSDAVALDALTIAPGESVVFFIDGEAADYTAMADIWGYTGQLGNALGGSGLGQGGDGITLFNNDGTVFGFWNTAGGNLATWEMGLGDDRDSVLGENGAYESNPWDNDSFGGTQVTAIGSPGVVPAPAAIATLALGAFGIRRRR